MCGSRNYNLLLPVADNSLQSSTIRPCAGESTEPAGRQLKQRYLLGISISNPPKAINMPGITELYQTLRVAAFGRLFTETVAFENKFAHAFCLYGLVLRHLKAVFRYGNPIVNLI